jgi:hypothetical protein
LNEPDGTGQRQENDPQFLLCKNVATFLGWRR